MKIVRNHIILNNGETHELTHEDVGRFLFPNFGKITANDVGKRVTMCTFGLSMENAEQRDKRLANCLYNVTGDHPTLARPDRFNLTKAKAEEYAEELRSLGYENVTLVPRQETAKGRYATNADRADSCPTKFFYSYEAPREVARDQFPTAVQDAPDYGGKPLAEVLSERGYTTQPTAHHGKRHVLKGGVVVFTGTATEAWAWLDRQQERTIAKNPLLGADYQKVEERVAAQMASHAPQGWRQASLGDFLTDPQLEELAELIGKLKLKGLKPFDTEYTAALKELFAGWRGELEAKGVLPEYLAYAVAYLVSQGKLK